MIALMHTYIGQHEEVRYSHNFLRFRIFSLEPSECVLPSIVPWAVKSAEMPLSARGFVPATDTQAASFDVAAFLIFLEDGSGCLQTTRTRVPSSDSP